MIATNEAIIDCIYELLKNSDHGINDLVKITAISEVEMNEYLSCTKNIPFSELCIIAGFFNLGIDKFLIKAKILNNPNVNEINPEEIINFKASFMSLWDRENLSSQNFK